MDNLTIFQITTAITVASSVVVTADSDDDNAMEMIPRPQLFGVLDAHCCCSGTQCWLAD